MYPILFELGPITIFSKWLFIALGFVAASFLFVHLSKRNRIQLNVLTEHSFPIFFWTLVVSRITFVVMHWDLFFTSSILETFLNCWKSGIKDFHFGSHCGVVHQHMVFLAQSRRIAIATA